jgi:hypothetical protein
MCKRAMLLLLALMTVPSFASAATYWQITATTSPTALKTNLTAARPSNFGNYTTPGGDTKTLTKVTVNPYASVDFDVAAAPGYAVSNVKVDGVTVGSAAGTYTVNKGTTLSHTIVAYYTVANYTLTTQPAAGGTISASQTYSANGTVTAIPSNGYTLKGLKIGATTYLLADTLPGGVSKTGDVSGATYTFASGSYTVQGVFAAAPAASTIIITPGQTIATGSSILVDGSASSSNITPTNYAWSNTCGALTADSDPKKVTFVAPASVGSCTVTLTMTGTGINPAPKSVTFAIQNPLIVATNQCLACHNGTDGPAVPNFTTSKHNVVMSCASCHNPASTTTHPFSSVTAATCENCHAATLSTTTHPVAITASKCLVCHNSHDPAEGIANLGQAPAHPAVTLYTFEEIGMQMAGGAKVPVQVDANGKGMPYSPKQTCGTAGCHVKNGIDYTYDKISDHAFHASQGRSEYVDSIDGKLDATKNKPWYQSTAMVGKW